MTKAPNDKPIIGDDGELLHNDPNVDMEAYQDYVHTPRRIRPSRWRRLTCGSIVRRISIIFIALVIFALFLVLAMRLSYTPVKPRLSPTTTPIIYPTVTTAFP